MTEHTLHPVAHAERAHAKCSASGSHAWLVCTMKPTMEEGLENPSNRPSLIGTWGHERNDIQLRYWLGQVGQTEYIEQLKAHEADTTITADEKDWVRPFSDDCVRWAQKLVAQLREQHGEGNVLVMVEQRLDFSRFVPEGFGTSDLTILVPGKAYQVDWKLGRREVAAFDNPQMKLYGVGTLEMFSLLYDLREVEMWIVQPTIGNYDSMSMPADDLYAWAESIVPIAQAAFSGEGAKFVPDTVEDHGQCQWCLVRRTCKARADAAVAVAGEMEDPRLISQKDLVRLYALAPAIAGWCKDVEQHFAAQVLAGDRTMGYKVVEGKSNRAISDEGEMIKRLEAEGYMREELYLEPSDPPLKPLGELEKLVGKARLAKVLEGVLVKPKGKPTVVPMDDKRDDMGALQSSAEDDFDGLE